MSNLNNVSAGASALADTIDWAVVPKAGVCGLYLGHVYDNICRGNADRYDYLLNWMAAAVQFPSRLPGVAIALHGAAGTGKGVFMTHLGALFGAHFAHIGVGRFHGHLEEAVLVFADEVPAAGNRRHEWMINTTHLIAASNADWIVPADQARLWLVLSVGDARKNDYTYFSAIDDEMHDGGREALLHVLLHRDLTGVDLHDVPMTAEA
jgi:hypothetical protein